MHTMDCTNSDAVKSISNARGWSRSGCATCKRRRKKCDETKPTCGPCNRLRISCVYDSAWTAPKTPCSAWPGSSRRAGKRPRGETSLWLAGPPIEVESSPESLYYLSYYTAHLSSWLVMVDAACNPLRQTIVPRLSASQMLFDAVCAVSACHLSQRSQQHLVGTQKHGLLGVRYYMRAMNRLSAHIGNGGAGQAEDATEALILTAAFLCKYEIIRGSTREWRHHLTGLVQLMAELNSSGAGVSHSANKFLDSFITYHWEIAHVTSSATTRLHLQAMGPTPNSLSANDGPDELDTYMGVAKNIVGLLGRISRASQALRDGWAANSCHIPAELGSIHDALQSWDIDDMPSLSTSALPAGVSARDVHNLRLTATAFHSAALAYLYTVMGSMSGPGSAATANRYGEQKRQAVARGLGAIQGIPGCTPCESALVLPLFVMGCEADDEGQQAYALQRLRGLEANVGLGNITRARMVVEQVQMRGEDGGYNCGGPRWDGVVTQLDWDMIIT